MKPRLIEFRGELILDDAPSMLDNRFYKEMKHEYVYDKNEEIDVGYWYTDTDGEDKAWYSIVTGDVHYE